MSETAQIILAIGVASFLILLAAVGVIWSIRCHARSESYRFPLAVSVPLLLASAIALQRLL